MGKFSDDIPLKPVGTVQPSVVSALLRQLKMQDATRAQQEAAVKKWLKGKKPTPLLRRSLERHGFEVPK